MNIARFSTALALAAAAWMSAAAPGWATPLSAEEILQQFNLVVLGDLDSTSEVEGRTYVGGNLAGASSNYFIRGSQSAPSDFAALVVRGNVGGGSKNVNSGGSVAIGGNLGTRIDLNGSGGKRYVAGNVTVPQNGPAANTVRGPLDIPDFGATLKQLSSDLKQVSANSTATVTDNRGIFSGMPSADGLAVFWIDGPSFFGGIGELSFALNGAETMIINVAGTAITVAENFLGGIGRVVAPHIVWNFFEATSITFGAEFFGSVLAPYADVTNINALNGSVVVNRFTQRGEVHLPVFAGQLPPGEPDRPIEVSEPGSVLLLLPGLLLLLALRRQPRSMPAAA